MKKIFSLIITLFSLVIFSLNFNAFASEKKFNLGYESIKECDLFYGMNEEELYNYSFMNLIHNCEKQRLIKSGDLDCTLKFKTYKASFPLTTTLTFLDGKITTYKASCNGDIFYQINISNSDYQIDKFKPYIIKEVFNESATCQEYEGRFSSDNLKYYIDIELNDLYTYKSYFYPILSKIIFGQIMIENDPLIINTSLSTPSIDYIIDYNFNNPYVYKSNFITLNNKIKEGTYDVIVYDYIDSIYYRIDTSIIASINELAITDFEIILGEDILEEDIINQIEKINNLKIKDYKIDLSNYDNNKIHIGEYNCNINFIASNTYYYLQFKIIINSKNQSPTPTTTTPTSSSNTIIPTTTIKTNFETSSTAYNNEIILTNNLEYSYKERKSKEDIIKDLVIKNKDNYNIEIISDYFDYDSIPDEYEALVTITNDSGNKYEKIIILKIIDDVSPVIIGANYTVSASKLLSLNEFQNRLLAVDEIDGEISCKNIKINDLNNYQNSNNKVGIYQIEAIVLDTSGNEAKCYFDIIIENKNDYGIYIENKIINLTNSYKISKDNIISYLSKNGLVNSKNINVSSNYFETNDNIGDYQLIINNNLNDTYTIHILDETNNKKNTIEETKENNFDYRYIIYGAITLMLIIIIILFILTLKKKKTNK